MNTSGQEMLRALREKISALATSRVGPGDIHPGIISNIDEAVEALQSGRDRTGTIVSPERVASGLHSLVQYVSTAEWMTLASASLAHDSSRISMLKTYLFDLDQIAKVIEQPVEDSAPGPSDVEEEARTSSSSPHDHETLLQPGKSFEELFRRLEELSEQYALVNVGYNITAVDSVLSSLRNPVPPFLSP